MCEYHAEKHPWSIACDVTVPCATENEIHTDDAKLLLKNGCKVVSEGANMTSTIEAVNEFLKAKILYVPGKAANIDSFV